MNKTKIEWADSTWNPVTGCYHDCAYCYARGTARWFSGCDNPPNGADSLQVIDLKERLTVTDGKGKTRNAMYPFGFKPTLHEYRLGDPIRRGFGETIFVCSMADLFGEWVPDEWIEKVFDACKAAAGHRYLFLTKNPARYIKLAQAGKLPAGDEFWYGSTTTGPDVEAFWADTHKTFVSIEPLLEPFGARESGLITLKTGWAIIGAETGNRKDKVTPKAEWVAEIVDSFHSAGKPVFMKDSLIPIVGESGMVREFPWSAEKPGTGHWAGHFRNRFERVE